MAKDGSTLSSGAFRRPGMTGRRFPWTAEEYRGIGNRPRFQGYLSESVEQIATRAQNVWCNFGARLSRFGARETKLNARHDPLRTGSDGKICRRSTFS